MNPFQSTLIPNGKRIVLNGNQIWLQSGQEHVPDKRVMVCHRQRLSLAVVRVASVPMKSPLNIPWNFNTVIVNYVDNSLDLPFKHGCQSIMAT
jgi:hypothetical protein